MKSLRISILGLVIGASLFGILCFVFHTPNLNQVAWASGIGGFTGLLAAPEFCPRSFKTPKLFQTVSGAGLGLTVSFFFGWPLLHIGIAAFAGAVLGFFAHYWVEHVNVP